MTAVRTSRTDTRRAAPRRAAARPAARPAARTNARTPARPTPRPRPAARQAGSTSTRAAARSLPQETTGPLLRVFPRRTVSLRATLGVSSLLFFAVLAGAVTIQAQRIEGQHRLDRIESDLADARDRNRELRASVAVAESPDRVMAEALAMGLVEPGPVLPLVSVGSATTPTTPTAPAGDVVDPGVAAGAGDGGATHEEAAGR